MLTPLSMQLIQLAPGELNWDLNFSPKSIWPKAMPIVAARTNSLPLVITGFERQSEKTVQVLVLDEPIEALCAALWPQLMGGGQNSLEALRLKRRLHAVLSKNSNFEAETKELIDFLVALLS